MTCNFVVKPNGGCPDNYWCHTGIFNIYFCENKGKIFYKKKLQKNVLTSIYKLIICKIYF